MFELFAGEVAFQGASLGHLIFQIGGFLGRAFAVSPLQLLHPHTSLSCLALALCWSSGGSQGCTFVMQCTSASGRLFLQTARLTTQNLCRSAGRMMRRCGRRSRMCWRRCRRSSVCCVPGGRGGPLLPPRRLQPLQSQFPRSRWSVEPPIRRWRQNINRHTG